MRQDARCAWTAGGAGKRVGVRNQWARRFALWTLAWSAASLGAAPQRVDQRVDASGAPAAAPAAPAVSVEVLPRRLRLHWSAVAGARYYLIYEKRSASAPFKPVGPPSPAHATAREIPISAHVHSWEHARYSVAACNLAGCARSAPVGARGLLARAVEALTSEFELHEPTNASRNQQYGGQVALSADGRTLAVADLWYYGGAEWPWYGSGAVYVYRRMRSGWALQAKLEPPQARGYDFFGADVALSVDGNTLAVGAQYEGYDAPSQEAGPGAVFVFTRRGGEWTQQAMLRAANPQDGASFGRSVEVSAFGAVIAVGAPEESVSVDGGRQSRAGAVYVFSKRGSEWTPHAELRAPAPESHDLFGLGVRLSKDGRTLAVLAAEQNDGTEDFDNGGWPGRDNTLYVFGRDGAEWALQAEFTGSPADPMLGGTSYEPEGQVEGFDLSADGRLLAIASPFAAGPDGGAGVVRLYRRVGGVWRPSGALTPSLADRRMFGLRLSLSSDGRMLAATSQRDDGAYGQPYVVVFVRRDGRWTQASALQSPAWPQYSSFGDSLALSWSGKRLVVGARAFQTEHTWWGAALVY